jgi:UDP-N-acetylglucosamine transferase subunit ALG13
MIFVTVGTNEARFDRLLNAVAALPPTDEEIVVQYGSSIVRPANATLHEFLPFERIVDHVRRARIVVTHAGVGSIIVALSNGKHPIVVPRLKRYDEAVDDHQLFFGRRFAQAGLVTFVESPDGVRDAIATEREGTGFAPKAGALVGDLRSFIERSIAA